MEMSPRRQLCTHGRGHRNVLVALFLRLGYERHAPLHSVLYVVKKLPEANICRDLNQLVSYTRN